MREPDQTREFMRRFAANLSDKGNHVVAYVLTEDEWSGEFGKKFYKNYNSFKDCKSHFLKKYRRLPSSKTFV
jgi:aspartate/tyrosine/aromatic aminotransferase